MPIIRQVKGRYKGSRKQISPIGYLKQRREWFKHPLLRKKMQELRRMSDVFTPLEGFNPYSKIGLGNKFRRRAALAGVVGTGLAGWKYLDRRDRKEHHNPIKRRK